MSLKTILFALGFFACCALGPFLPHIGVIGYMLHYSIGPSRQWWAAPLNAYGIRYSFTLAIVTAVGLVLNWSKMRIGKSLLMRQEWLLLLFLAVIWLSRFIGDETVGRYTRPGIDHPSVKMIKLVIFTLMLTHIVTRMRHFDFVLWTLVIGGLILGLQAYDTPRSSFISGRLEKVGGPDFRDANALAGYLVVLIPIIGIKFLRSNWPGKLLCAASGAFAMNAIVLCRSRASVLGLAAGGIVLSILTPRKYRLKIIICLIIVGCGFTYLMDPQFVNRTQTIFHDEENRDRSAQSRIEIWQGGIKMIKKHPEGVGVGNFYQKIGSYAPQHPGRDAHNTYIRCGAELGLHGLVVLLLLIGNALLMNRRIGKESQKLPVEHRSHFQWTNCALAASVVSFITIGMTGSLVYHEAWWWFIMMPVCLQRCLDNLNEDLIPLKLQEDSKPQAFGRIKRKKTGVPAKS
jgi:O-antigen ligase